MTKKKNSKKGGHYMSYVMYHMCTNTHTSHFNTLEQPRTTTTIIHVSRIKFRLQNFYTGTRVHVMY